MKPITLLQPARIEFGSGCMEKFVTDYLNLGYKKLFVLTTPPVFPLIKGYLDQLTRKGVGIEIYDQVVQEPTVTEFYGILEKAKNFGADSVVGIGGGSVLDTAKLVAALNDSEQKVEEIFGTGLLKGRNCWMALMPTTAGTGSEVSPNSILLDEEEKLKKGIVSPFLVADVAYVDPKLTLTVPPKVTAETGMDALTHCIEAYTNKFAHPVIDMYALEGIRLISQNLLKAVKDGSDLEAREALLLGSLYGGLCLGPVNTAAVHALSYPLGGEFHISHGLANSILLPSVMRFNCTSDIDKFAEITVACGVEPAATKEETVEKGVQFITSLAVACGIPEKLSDLNIPESAVEGMTEAAMKVTRLLKNNPREFTHEDARNIYKSLF